MEEVVTNKGRGKRKAMIDETQRPVHTITVVALMANIYLRQAPSGYAYFAYNIKRTYQSLTTKNQIHSTDFFAENKSDILVAVTQASVWIAKEAQRTHDESKGAA